MNNRKPTIYDIAKSLNITASTVSRALNNHPKISDKTKKIVLKEAAKQNYQPNHIAAALRSGKSKIIGVIVPTSNRSFFSSVVRGIEEVANRELYNVMICQSHDDYLKEVQTVEALLNARVDGIIVSIAKESEKIDHFLKVKQKGIPLILFDRSREELGVGEVVIDDYEGAYMAVSHLIENGYKRIAHFCGNQKISIYRDRCRGYKAALKDNGMPYDPNLLIESNLQLEDGIASMNKFLKLDLLPDAIFSSSDYAAMGAMEVLKSKNISIPEEIGLVGFSNEPFTRFSEPALTTVNQHSIKIGNLAAELFLQQIKYENTSLARKTIIKPELIIRSSSLKGGSKGPESKKKTISKSAH